MEKIPEEKTGEQSKPFLASELEASKKEEKTESYAKGVLFINISVFCMALQSMFTKLTL